MSVEYMSGLAVGVMVAVVALVVIMRFLHSDGKVRTQWDERQLVARGKAFMAAFWVLVAGCAVILVMESIEANPWSVPCELVVALFVSLAVQICVSVAKDAYFGLNEENRSRIYVVFAIFALGELAMGVRTVMVEGIVNLPATLYLSCGSLILAVFVALMVKAAADKRLED